MSGRSVDEVSEITAEIVGETSEQDQERAQLAMDALRTVAAWPLIGSMPAVAGFPRIQSMPPTPAQTILLVAGPRLETVSPDDVKAMPRAAARLAAYRVVRSFVRAIASSPGWVDNPVAQELLDQTLELEERIEQDPDGTDPEWRVKEVVDHIGELVQVLVREQQHDALDDPANAAYFVLEHLRELEQDDIAELLGVDPRTIRDWKSNRTKTIRKNPDRVTLIGQLVYDLRRAMTPRGISRWFRRPRPQLDGQAPLDLISSDTAAAAEQLRPLARSARGQLGT